MPYVKQEIRDKINSDISSFTHALHCEFGRDVNPGILNYVFSSIIRELFDKNPCYSTANDLMGVLECVKQEFYRRKVAPYEDEKIKENGDL